MLSATDIADKVDFHRRDLADRFGADHSFRLIPKIARVASTTQLGTPFGYNLWTMRTERGLGYPASQHLQRTVFRPAPIKINDEYFYAEIKGYGANGQYLYAANHIEGDLHFGMYLSTAQKEFNFLNVAAKIPHRTSPQAVALLEFPCLEFIKQCYRTIANYIVEKKNPFGKNEVDVAKKVCSIHRNEGTQALIERIQPLLNHEDMHIVNQLDKIKDKAGYLVRAVRAPLRIIYWNELGIKKSDAEEAVYKSGKLYRSLLNRKMIHLVPSLANITIAGELNDFEDVELVTDHIAILNSWELIAKRYSTSTFQKYIATTIGPAFLEDFTETFLDGVNLARTPQKTAKAIIEMHQKAFAPLTKIRL